MHSLDCRLQKIYLTGEAVRPTKRHQMLRFTKLVSRSIEEQQVDKLHLVSMLPLAPQKEEVVDFQNTHSTVAAADRMDEQQVPSDSALVIAEKEITHSSVALTDL
ncbi:hypothetical protein ANCCAN_01859 [Ancylostoma caninum]|uniref:Uncharacterized protein n=1 Tax=Ancylostoma caninum TaxID=29170 RepID=A0A368H642_ANCCA|nr:hypothetical protein ANCCAN_01859 [Ancylostoma caninum]